MSASVAARKALSSFLLPTTVVGAGYASQQLQWGDKAVTSTTKCEGGKAYNSTKASVERKANLQKRMTAIGHFSLKTETDSNPSVPTFFLALSNTKPEILNPSKRTLTPSEFEQTWLGKSMPEKHPRFHQRVSSSLDGYFEEKGADELHHHIVETIHPMVYRQDLKRRIESLVSSVMDVKDKLWEVQISSGDLGSSGAISKRNVEEIENRNAADRTSFTSTTSKKETVLLFKCHHSLGDAVSLVAALGDLLDEAEEIKEKIRKEIARRRNLKKKGGVLSKMLNSVKKLIWFLFGSIHALIRHGYLILTTRKNPFLAVLGLTKEEGLELAKLGRSVSWCDVASVAEVKTVAKILGGPKATVNDVFVSCVSAAVARQLEEHRKKVIAQKGNSDVYKETMQTRLNVVIPSHLAGGILPPGRGIGNLIGAFVAQVPGEMDTSIPSKRLSIVHDELYTVKRSPAAILSYAMAKGIAKYFPERLAIRMFESSSANAAVAITNSRGFEKKVHINGRTVESMAGFLPLPPGLPVGVVVGSYGSEISLSVNADKWAVPDADLFLSWVLDEYKLLCKEAALKAENEQVAR